jgi:hypothetical protein
MLVYQNNNPPKKGHVYSEFYRSGTDKICIMYSHDYYIWKLTGVGVETQQLMPGIDLL